MRVQDGERHWNCREVDAKRALFEARVAERAEAQAINWRFRLVIIETVMIASLVLAAGIALDLPLSKTLTGAATVGIGCFLTGLMLIGLTGAVSRLAMWWGRR